MAALDAMPDSGRPLLLVEYAHAMGNGPGGLADYWDFIYRHANLCGGFVWEFKGHGFCTKDRAGNEYPLYGGDFGDQEKYNWYNFCLDGFLTADGTPKPTWYELGEVLAPIRATFDGTVRLTNTNDFRNVDDTQLVWTLHADDQVCKTGRIDRLSIAPHETRSFSASKIDFVPERCIGGARYYLDLEFSDGKTRKYHKQLELPYGTKKQMRPNVAYRRRVTRCADAVRVETDAWQVAFRDVLLCVYTVDGQVLLRHPMRFNFYRAGTDNDGVMPPFPWFPKWFFRRKAEWAEAFLKTMRFCVRDTDVTERPDAVAVRFTGQIVPETGWYGFHAVITYTVLADGLITVQIDGDPFGKIPAVLPRIGVVFALDRSRSTVEWYGRGPDQNYSDACAAAPMGRYRASVDALNFPFDMPQETGNHAQTRFVCVSDGAGAGISVIGNDEFCFSYHNFSLDALDRATHKDEVPSSDQNFLYIDYKMRGLGSRSCGPEPEAPYELHPHRFRFGFALCDARPVDALRALARSDLSVTTAQLSGAYRCEEQPKVKQIADCTEE